MAALFALVSGVCFALAAALQQRGQFRLVEAGSAVRGPAAPFRLVAVPVWLFGTLILLVGCGTRGGALHGGIAEAAGGWRTWALLGFGFAGFLIQQLANRETQVPGQPTGTDRAVADKTLR